MVKRIAVLTTCYNRVETTLRCLRALLNQTISNQAFLEVWLVDDASPDGTGERVRAETVKVYRLAMENLRWQPQATA